MAEELGAEGGRPDFNHREQVCCSGVCALCACVRAAALAGLAREVCEANRPLAESKGQSLVMDLAGPLSLCEPHIKPHFASSYAMPSCDVRDNCAKGVDKWSQLPPQVARFARLLPNKLTELFLQNGRAATELFVCLPRLFLFWPLQVTLSSSECSFQVSKLWHGVLRLFGARPK